MEDRPVVDHPIGVANLDAVEQTRLWLSLGAREATRTLVGALRTALLLADTVVVDRNQVFEGIFFVAVSPDRLAWHLGLPPGAPLPIRIGLLNPGEGDLSEQPDAPWTTGAGPIWALPADLLEQVERNYLAVPGDRQRVSSPMVALTGRYEGQECAAATSVNAPRATEAWAEDVDPAFLPEHVWRQRDPTLASEVIRRGRAAWLEAMRTGRVQVEPWRQVALDIGPALERALPLSGRARELALTLLRLEETVGHTLRCTAVHPALGGEPCGRRHAGRRSLVVRWLDGHEVAELSPTSLEPVWAEATYAEREMAFRWWNAAYYDAICERDDLRLLNLHNVSSTSAAGADAEVEWGLRRPVPSRWERVRTRLSTRSVGASGGDLAIEGEVVRHLVELGPWQFATLRDLRVVDREALWREPSNRRMFDLALAVREMTGEHTSRRARMLIAAVRVVALGLLATAFAFRDAGYLPTSGGLLVTSWIVLGILAAFPWDAVSSLVRMSPGGLESSLRIRE